MVGEAFARALLSEAILARVRQRQESTFGDCGGVGFVKQNAALRPRQANYCSRCFKTSVLCSKTSKKKKESFKSVFIVSYFFCLEDDSFGNK